LTPEVFYVVGGTIVVADKVLQDEVDSTFTLVCLPGYHVVRVVHGARGFCNVNIEAIGQDTSKKTTIQRESLS
jgi:Histone deacetylase domain.